MPSTISLPACVCGHCGPARRPQMVAPVAMHIPRPTPATTSSLIATFEKLALSFDNLMDSIEIASAQLKTTIAHMNAAIDRPDFLEPLFPRPPPIDTAGPAAAKAAEAMAATQHMDA